MGGNDLKFYLIIIFLICLIPTFIIHTEKMVIPGLILGIIIFTFGLMLFRNKRLIENIPTSKIQSLAMGLAEISGKVIPFGRLLKSPFSGTPCVYYKYTAVELSKINGDSQWVIKSDEDSVKFYLKDDSGRVMVDPDWATISLSKYKEFDPKSGKKLSKSARAFLKGALKKVLMSNRIRIKEYIIAPGDKIYVMGTAGKNPFVKMDEAKSSVDRIMMQRGVFNRFYLISDRHEKEIVKNLKRESLLSILFGAILIIVCLAIILLYPDLTFF